MRPLIFFVIFFILAGEIVFAQQGVISQQNAISGLNDLLAQKKIAVDVIDTVDSSGQAGKFTRIISDEAQVATRIKRILGQRPNIYFDKGNGAFVGPGQATGAKIARADLVDNAGQAVKDHWKLQERLAGIVEEQAKLRAKARKINRIIIPELERQLAGTRNPIKRFSLNRQISKATAEAANSTAEASKLTAKIRESRNATKTLFNSVNKSGKALSKTERLWSWLKAKNAANNITGFFNPLRQLGISSIKTAPKLTAGLAVKRLLFVVGAAYDLVHIIAPYSNLFQETVGPNIVVTADYGGIKHEPIISTDDGNTHVFFNTLIEPNSQLNIRKVEAFREYWKQNEDLFDTVLSATGLFASDVYEYIADYGQKSGEDQFVITCNLKLYKYDNSRRQRTELVAEAGFPECLSGNNTNLEWTINKQIPPGSYQLILRAIFDPVIIVFSKDEIKARSNLFEDILSTDQVQSASEEKIRSELVSIGAQEEEIQRIIDRSREVQSDPLIWNILNFGMPAKTIPIEYNGEIESAKGEGYKVSDLSVYSKSTLTPKNQFNTDELNDIQIWFNFAYGVEGFWITVFPKNNPEEAFVVTFEDERMGPFPNGNPKFKKEQTIGASYVYDSDIDPENFQQFIEFISKEGRYEIGIQTAYYTEKGEQLLNEEYAATTPLIIGNPLPADDPVGGEITNGYVIFRIVNKEEIESTGINLGEYVAGLKIKRNGEEIASFNNTDEGKRIYLQEDYLIINNISKSNEQEIIYDIEWGKPGYKIGKGNFTVEINDSDLKEGHWTEGDTID